jgi:predicted DNA-binding protein with PD1-like motif
MRSKLLNADPPITYAVVLDTTDEVIGELSKFVREQEVEAAR